MNFNGLTQFLMLAPMEAARAAYGHEHPEYLKGKAKLFKRNPGYFLADLDPTNRARVVAWTNAHGW